MLGTVCRSSDDDDVFLVNYMTTANSDAGERKLPTPTGRAMVLGTSISSRKVICVTNACQMTHLRRR
jgi:hypothetical protein